MSSAEQFYWKRKLPRGFQTQLESIGRAIIRGQPDDVYEFIAAYLEGKLVARNGKTSNNKCQYSQFIKQKKKQFRNT